MPFGSLTPGTYPSDIVTVQCDECGRIGRYRRQTLIDRFGADTPMPDILSDITDCQRNDRLSVSRYRAVFGELGAKAIREA